jgi:hypothetical protein
VDTGNVISGTGHLALIGWMFFGSVFRSDPPPFEMTEVSVISGAEYEALLAAQQPPDTAVEVAQPDAPEVAPEVPEVAAQPDEAIEQPAPLPTETPPPDDAPEVAEQQQLPPETEVDDTPPVLDEPVGDVAVLVPEVAPQAVPRPVERVAPEPVAQPEPDAMPAEEPQEAVAPDAEGETVEPPQEAAAPEEATTEIVTEATKAPAASSRPPGRRPTAPVQQAVETPEPAETPRPAEVPQPVETAEAPEPVETPAPVETPVPAEEPAPDTSDVDADAIAAAVAAAAESVAETPQPAVPTGPPLSNGEKESLRVAVSACWNVGSLSSEALSTTVIVSVSMNQDGTPNTGSITLEGSEGGSDGAARQAFEAARRAIIRCGAKGYNLPAEKFGQWQTIEMTFNPERMRIK